VERILTFLEDMADRALGGDWIAVGGLIWIVLAVVILGLLAVWIKRRQWAKEIKQEKLASAFDRAARVRGSGTGEQGKPYSVYGPRSWGEDR
jgi:hypothetical protein